MATAGRARVRFGVVALCTFAMLTLGGCAGEPAPTATPSTNAPTVTPIPTTPPTTSPEASLDERAAEIVADLSVRDQVALITMSAAPGTDAAELDRFLDDTGIGGFILMGDNVPETPAALRELTSTLATGAELPRLIAVDQEGGDVSRLPWDTHASARTLQTEAPAATEQAFSARAQLLAEAEIPINFGIVADVPASADDFIASRALGMTPADSSERVSAAVQAESALVHSTVKHFPGHGVAAGDSHETIPATDLSLDAWREGPALPFEAGIDAGADLLMFGHLRFTDVDDAPASLSETWHRIARDDLGFTGVSVTDDLGMLLQSGETSLADPVANAVRALAAGNDLLLWVVGSDEQGITEMVDGVAAAVRDGTVDPARLEEAATRVVSLQLRIAGYPDEQQESKGTP